MRQRLRRASKITIGALLLVLGGVGLLLPLVPQIPFFIVGLTVLSTESRRAKTLLHRLEEQIGWRRHDTAVTADPGRPDDAH